MAAAVELADEEDPEPEGAAPEPEAEGDDSEPVATHAR